MERKHVPAWNGEILKKHREARRWAPEYLGEMLGTSKGHVSNWESGTEPRGGYVLAIAMLFNLSPESFFTGTESFRSYATEMQTMAAPAYNPRPRRSRPSSSAIPAGVPHHGSSDADIDALIAKRRRTQRNARASASPSKSPRPARPDASAKRDPAPPPPKPPEAPAKNPGK